MKPQTKFISIAVIIVLFAACASNHKNRQGEEDKTIGMPPPAGSQSNASGYNSSKNLMMSSTAAVQNDDDTLRKFIRTVDARFRAKDVIKASYTIEDIVRHFGGIVTYTDMRSNVDNVTSTPISADSLLETTYYTTVNSIVIRVPNHQLDTTLKCFAPVVDFLDYRIIKANNVKFRMLWRMFEEMRLSRHNERLSKAIDSKGNSKLDAASEAENDLLAKDADKDNAVIENMKTEDSIKYSCITLSVYQRSSVKRELLMNEKNITAYQPGFWHKLADALKDGWEILTAIILGLAQIWTILLILGIGIYYVYRRWKKISVGSSKKE